MHFNEKFSLVPGVKFCVDFLMSEIQILIIERKLFMKKIALITLLILIFALTLTAGAENTNLIINSKEELYTFAESVNSGNSYEGMNVILNTDIYLNDNLLNSEGEVSIENPVEWTCIGTVKNPFKGTFDGNGNSVYGIYINNASDYGGLFGVVSNAVIKNIYVKNSYIKTAAQSGAVVGYASSNSVISDCHNSGSRIYTDSRSGGVVGWTENSDVYNCSNTGYVFSGRCSGGIVGDVYSDGKIYNCENAGTVDGNHELTGGISGGTTGADIKNCLNVGEVKMGYLIAGGPGDRSIENCFAYQTSNFNSGIEGPAYIFDNLNATLSNGVNIGGQTYTDVISALNAFKDTIETQVSMTAWSKSGGIPTLGGVIIEKPSETEILSYDAVLKKTIIYQATGGKHIVIFACYDENKNLNKADIVEDDYTAGTYGEVEQKDKSFSLCNGDKIMIWENSTNLKPLCEVFTVSE